ncbi:MAG TPA: S41 family peptidase [Gemmatimonadota bacterium]|nr:S41 family peptidase [Gemmatimonadota bacterium]
MRLRGLAVSAALLLCCVPQLAAQDRLSRAEALEDLRYAIHLLEETHPDPYTGFGGVVEFKRSAQTLLEAVPEEGLTRGELYRLLRTLFAELRDGHSYVSAPPASGGNGAPRYLPVRFGIATDAIFVAGAVAPFDDLIGSRLVGVQGLNVEQASELAAAVYPVENVYGVRRWLLRFMISSVRARRLFPDLDDGLTVQLEAGDGTRSERRLPYSIGRGDYADAAWVTRRRDVVDAQPGPFSWRFLADSSTAYLRISSIVGREAFEELRAVGRRDLGDQVAGYYERYLDAPMPESMDEALAGVPCFTEAIRQLLIAMREQGSGHLIIDLRGNGGGWSALAAPLLHLLYGDRYYNYEFPVTFVTRISPSHLALNGQTLAEFNFEQGTEYQLGDYQFMEERSLASEVDREALATGLAVFGCGLAESVRSLNGAALYTPSVVVLIDPGTFSAAYHFAYRLRHLGAQIVGVPSAQAGNAFVDVTPFRLPRSELEGSIARTAQILFPGDPENGRVLMPDFPMSYEQFQRYRFDEHSELLYALDLIAAGSIR